MPWPKQITWSNLTSLEWRSPTGAELNIWLTSYTLCHTVFAALGAGERKDNREFQVQTQKEKLNKNCSRSTFESSLGTTLCQWWTRTERERRWPNTSPRSCSEKPPDSWPFCPLPTRRQHRYSHCSSLLCSSPSLRAQPPFWRFSFTFLNNLPLIERHNSGTCKPCILATLSEGRLTWLTAARLQA